MFKLKNNILIIIAILLILIIINHIFFKKNVENYKTLARGVNSVRFGVMNPVKLILNKINRPTWIQLMPNTVVNTGLKATVTTFNKRVDTKRNGYTIYDGDIYFIENITNTSIKWSKIFDKTVMKTTAKDVTSYENINNKTTNTDIIALGSDHYMYYYNNLKNKWHQIPFLVTKFAYSNGRWFLISNNYLYYFYDFTKLSGGYEVNVSSINKELQQVCYDYNSGIIVLLTRDGMMYHAQTSDDDNIKMKPINWKLIENTVKNISYIYLFNENIMYISNNILYMRNVGKNSNGKSIIMETGQIKPVTVCFGGYPYLQNDHLLVLDTNGNTNYTRMVYNDSLTK